MARRNQHIGERRVGRRAEQKRRWDWDNRNTCSCGALCRRGSRECVTCYRSAKRARLNEKREEIHRLWHAGLTHGQIATAIGTSKATIQSETMRMREAGWDLPKRRGGRPRRLSVA